MANMVAVKRDGDPYKILIPVIELIRFYYAVSTDMAHAIFSGDLKHQLNNLINPAKCGFVEEENRCIIHVRQHLSDEDGWVLGRIFSSDEAWNGATLPHDSMMINRMNSKFCHPESSFPFSGHTNLQLRGKFFRASDGWRFLEFSIEHCSAPFPFENLTVGRDNNNDQVDDESNDKEKKPAFPGEKHKGSDGNKPFQNQEEPNKDKTNEHIELPTNKFGAIAGKKIDRLEKEECNYESGLKHVPKGDDSEKLGTGQGNDPHSNSGKGAADQRRTRRQALPASFEVFEEAIRLLNQSEGFQARIRTVEEAIEFIPLTKPSSKRQWSYLDSSSYCRRQVIIGDVTHSGCNYVVVKVEARTKENLTAAILYKNNGGVLSNLTLNHLLLKLAHSKGVWKRASGEVEIIRMKHTWSSANHFSDSISARIKTCD